MTSLRRTKVDVVGAEAAVQAEMAVEVEVPAAAEVPEEHLEVFLEVVDEEVPAVAEEEVPAEVVEDVSYFF